MIECYAGSAANGSKPRQLRIAGEDVGGIAAAERTRSRILTEAALDRRSLDVGLESKDEFSRLPIVAKLSAAKSALIVEPGAGVCHNGWSSAKEIVDGVIVGLPAIAAVNADIEAVPGIDHNRRRRSLGIR